MYPTGPQDPSQGPGPAPTPPPPDAPFVSPALRPPPSDPAEWRAPVPPPRRRGRALVWTLSVVAAVIVVAVAAVLILRMQAASRPSVETGMAEMPVHQLRTGDCIDPLPASGPVSRVTAVSCGEYHAAQVVATIELTELPDAAGAESSCDVAGADALSAAAQQPDVEPKLTYLAPSTESWQRGDRTLSCLVYADSPGLRGTLVPPSAG